MYVTVIRTSIYRTLTAMMIIMLALFALPVTPASAAPDFAFPLGFVSETVVANLTGPTTIAFAPDGRLFIGQKDGRVRVFEDVKLLRMGRAYE